LLLPADDGRLLAPFCVSARDEVGEESRFFLKEMPPRASDSAVFFLRNDMPPSSAPPVLDLADGLLSASLPPRLSS
jgi:hypothetical protein